MKKLLYKTLSYLLCIVILFSISICLPITSEAAEDYSYLILYKNKLIDILNNPTKYVQMYTDSYGNVNLDDIKKAEFAIKDINGDGILDLIYSFSYTFTFSMHSKVFTVNKSKTDIIELTTLDPICEYFSNGLIKNSAKRYDYGTMLPIILYKYSEANNKYDRYASIGSANKRLDVNGKYYSERFDIDKDGEIYYYDNEAEKLIFDSLDDLNSFVESIAPSNQKIDMEWKNLCEDNIDQVINKYLSKMDFEIYKTNKIMAEYWNNIRLISKSSRYRIVVEDFKKNKSITSMDNLTKTYLSLCNLDSLKHLSEQQKSEYYYKIILSDIFIRQRSSSDFSDELYNKTNSLANNLEEYCKINIKDALKDGLKTNLRNNPKLKETIKKGLTKYEILSAENDVVQTIVDGVEVVGDLFSELSTYLAVKQLSVDTIDILETAASLSANNNLIFALNDFSSAYRESLSSIIDNAKNKTANEVSVLLLEKTITTVLEKALPGATVAKCIYSGGKLLSTLLTNSETTSTLYLQMCATYEFEDAIAAAVEQSKNICSSNINYENSKRFNSGCELMLNIANYGNNLLIDFSESLSSSLIGKLTSELGISNLDSKIEEFKNFRNNYILNYQNSLDLIYNLFIRDNPELYDKAIENYLKFSKFKLVCFYGYEYGIQAISNDNSIPNGANLSVRELSSSEEKRISGLFDRRQMLLSYDLSLNVDGTKVQINNNGYIIVRIPIPSDVRIECPRVFRTDEKGECVEYKASVVDGMIEFSTNHFSTYTIINDLDIGDANGDLTVDIIDATTIQKDQAQLIQLDSIHRQIADVDKDNILSVIDATIIQKYLAQIVEELG